MSSSGKFETHFMVKDFWNWLHKRLLALHQFFHLLVLAVNSFIVCEENVSMTHCSEYFRGYFTFGNLLLLSFKQFLPLIRVCNMLQRFEKIRFNSFHWVRSHILFFSNYSSCITISSWFNFCFWFLIYVRIWRGNPKLKQNYKLFCPLESLKSNSWNLALSWYFKSDSC